MGDCLCKFKSISEVYVFVGAVGIRLWSQDASDDDLCMCVLLAEDGNDGDAASHGQRISIRLKIRL